MAVTKDRTTLTLDRETKERASEVLDKLGLSMSAYIDLSLRQLVREQGFPFTPALRKEANDNEH